MIVVWQNIGFLNVLAVLALWPDPLQAIYQLACSFLIYFVESMVLSSLV
jgi:hypothetical protein